ncbi:MAG TPA: hypothetical protein VM841_09670, partial [Actinomycetota bacterium]|nr:hypothetical protein [Actinomycetota bacterium]
IVAFEGAICRRVAGQQITFAAQGFDQFGQSVGFVTSSTDFTISPDGACSGNVCVATIAGAHRVTATNGSATDLALFNVIPGPATRLQIAPSNATISPGDSQAYSATASDQFGNSLGDITGTTSFDITPDGDCTGAVCTATVAGPHTVTGTRGTLSDTASLNVMVGTVHSIAITPSSSSIPAGGSQTYFTEGFDEEGNSLGDVTGLTTFTIAPAGGEVTLASSPCAGNVCSATVAGPHTVTAASGEAIVTASLLVEPGEAATVVIDPASAAVPAGTPQSFTVVAFDGHGNEIGDVTEDTFFSIEQAGVTAMEAAGASCDGSTCTAYGAGEWLVRAAYGDTDAIATITVEAGPLASIELAPPEPTIQAGDTQEFTAFGYDEHGNPIEYVTEDTTFTIEPAEFAVEAEPTYGCADNVCGASQAGFFIVTGTIGEIWDTSYLTVEAGEPEYVVISSDASETTAGQPVEFWLEAFDGYGNSLDDVTEDANFTISRFDEIEAETTGCDDNACSATTAGTYIVTGEWNGLSDTTSLTVVEGPIDSLVLTPATSTVAPGQPQLYEATASDEYGNSWDATAATNFAIATGTCTNNSCSSSTLGTHTVTGTISGVSGTASLTIESPEGKLTISPANNTIDLGQSQTYTASFKPKDGTAFDVTDATIFEFSGDDAGKGSCTGNICTPNTTGKNLVIHGRYLDKQDNAKLTVNEPKKTSTAAVTTADAPAPVSPGDNTPAAPGTPAWTQPRLSPQVQQPAAVAPVMPVAPRQVEPVAPPAATLPQSVLRPSPRPQTLPAVTVPAEPQRRTPAPAPEETPVTPSRSSGRTPPVLPEDETDVEATAPTAPPAGRRGRATRNEDDETGGI